MDKSMSENCQSCKFWIRDSADRMQCRRFPPHGSSKYGFMFPATAWYDWCGEFRDKPSHEEGK